MRPALLFVFERRRLLATAAEAVERAVAARWAAEGDGAGLALPKSSAFQRLRRLRSHGFERVNAQG